MVKKNNDGPGSPESMAEQLQPLIDDDAFLTELSLGNDPSDGADELAALFLELREDVERQMPAAPKVEGADLEPVERTQASPQKPSAYERTNRCGCRNRVDCWLRCRNLQRRSWLAAIRHEPEPV